jgi:hypothetical protein
VKIEGFAGPPQTCGGILRAKNNLFKGSKTFRTFPNYRYLTNGTEGQTQER